MGSLTPGATYNYEYEDGVVYATEGGGVNKQVHGWMYDKDHPSFDPRTDDGRPLREHIMDAKMWGQIRRAARTNPTLQAAIDRVIIIYHLSKDNAK